MAKRGYRGKHPNNDMKVAPTSTKAANYSKLTDEYNKTGAKNKYDYIKSHDGFYPQGSAIIVCHADIATNNAITLKSIDGLSLEYKAKTSNTFASRFFNIGEVRYWHIFSILGAYFSPLLPAFNAIDFVLTKIPLVKLMAWSFTFELISRK